ncbi:MAG: TlpA disulfide reductase family protein [Gemmatimonas sp.]
MITGLTGPSFDVRLDAKAMVPRAVRLSAMLLFSMATACKPVEPKSEVMRKVPVAVGDIAPRFAALSLAGDSLIVGQPNSGVTLLNVWATWCTSCKEEFSELERYRKTFSATGLKVLAVSVDQGSDVKVRKFVEAQGAQFPVAHDAESRITALYGVGGLPTTYLLDAQGRVLWRAIGDFRLDSAGMASAIERALK